MGGGRDYLATQVVDLVVRAPNGDVILSAPDARIDLSPASLARLEIAAHRVTLRKVVLAVEISPQGVISVANLGAGPQTPTPAGEVASTLLAVLNGTMGVGGLPIPVIAVEEGRLLVDDQRRHTRFEVQNIGISADPADDGRPAIRVSGDSPGGRLVARIAPGTEPLSFDLSVDRISPLDIGAVMGDDLKFISSGVPLSVTLTARVNEQAVPQEVTGDVKIGEGHLYIDDPDAKPIVLDGASAHFAYSAADEIIKIQQVRLQFGRFRDDPRRDACGDRCDPHCLETIARRQGWRDPAADDAGQASDGWPGLRQRRP